MENYAVMAIGIDIEAIETEMDTEIEIDTKALQGPKTVRSHLLRDLQADHLGSLKSYLSTRNHPRQEAEPEAGVWGLSHRDVIHLTWKRQGRRGWSVVSGGISRLVSGVPGNKVSGIL
jgi:hypothetical protein